MTVIRTPLGWAVACIYCGAVMQGPFPTMGEAWRWVDRSTGEITNKSEERCDWFWQRMCDQP